MSRLPITDNVIFLGIDDGLVRDPQVLDLLRRAKVPFTMFLVQGAADTGEAFWQQAQKDGGTVEAHTITHPDLTKVSEQKRHDEICGTLEDFQERFGRRPTLFRPPYGAYDDAVRADVGSCGFKGIIMWKGSTNDGRFDLQEGPNLHPGDIILMHWRTDLYQNLIKVFDTVRAQGFSIGRLEHYFPDPPTTTTTRKSAKKMWPRSRRGSAPCCERASTSYGTSSAEPSTATASPIRTSHVAPTSSPVRVQRPTSVSSSTPRGSGRR